MSPRAYSNPDGERALTATYAALSCFVVAVFAPCFTIFPKFGGGWPERVANRLDPKSVEPQSFSLIGGIGHLLHDGDWLVGGILLLFSLLFPAAKLAVTLYLTQAEPNRAEQHAAVLSHLGKWSMLDVFVITGIVVSPSGRGSRRGGESECSRSPCYSGWLEHIS